MSKAIRKFRGQTTERMCRFCKQPFLIEKWAVKRGSGVYCSRDCWRKEAKTGFFVKYLKGYTKNHTPWNKGLHIYLGGKRFEKGHIPWFIAQSKPNPTTTPEGRRKLSLAGMGRPHPYKGKSVTWNTGKTWFKKGTYTEAMKKGSLAGAKVLSERKPTSIEIKVYEELKDRGFLFETQKIINGKFIVDAYIPSLNLVIEADGKYWHSLDKVVKRDRAKNAYLTKCGFKLLRLSEDEIKDGSFKERLVN